MKRSLQKKHINIDEVPHKLDKVLGIGMVRSSRKEVQRMLGAIAVLLRNTTWKCGRVERLIINYLRKHLRVHGVPRTSVRDMLQHFKLKGKARSEFFDALRRLERRHIIKIDMPSDDRHKRFTT